MASDRLTLSVYQYRRSVHVDSHRCESPAAVAARTVEEGGVAAGKKETGRSLSFVIHRVDSLFDCHDESLGSPGETAQPLAQDILVIILPPSDVEC